jgi:deaminated glutathione amidase
VGIHEPTTSTLPPPKLRNTLITITPAGIINRYQKLHLFDIDLSHANPPGPVLKESNTTEAGNEILPPFHLPDVPEMGRIGSLICFDIRFPEPSLSLRRQGADILLYPSAFTVPTGKLHWETLLRARAIECQCWIIASAQCGRHNGKRVSYGGSMVVDPNGVVVGKLGCVEDEAGENDGDRKPELLVVDVDLEVNERVRRGIPVGELRRWDVYPKL